MKALDCKRTCFCC